VTGLALFSLIANPGSAGASPSHTRFDKWIAINSWVDYLQYPSTSGIVSAVQRIEQFCQSVGVSCFSIGYASTPERIAIVPEISKNTEIVYCSSKIGDIESGIDFESARASAEVIKRISEETENGYGNF